jgi:hypothetical protein
VAVAVAVAVGVFVGVLVGVDVAVAVGVPHAATVQLIRWPAVTGGVCPVGSQANCVKKAGSRCVPIELTLAVCVVVLISP